MRGRPEAHQESGPFSQSLSAVMECINIGEPAGPATDALRVPRCPSWLVWPSLRVTTAACTRADMSRGMEYSYKPLLRCNRR